MEYPSLSFQYRQPRYVLMYIFVSDIYNERTSRVVSWIWVLCVVDYLKTNYKKPRLTPSDGFTEKEADLAGPTGSHHLQFNLSVKTKSSSVL